MAKSKACREKLAVYFRPPARTPQGAFCNRTARHSHRTAIANTKRTLSTTSGRQLRKYCVQDRAAVGQSAGSTKLRAPLNEQGDHQIVISEPSRYDITSAAIHVVEICHYVTRWVVCSSVPLFMCLLICQVLSERALLGEGAY